MAAFGRGPGRTAKGPEITELEREVEHTSKALKEPRSRTRAAGKSRWGLIGPIRGTRLAAEVKLQIVRAIHEAKAVGFPIDRASRVIMLEPRRLRRWVRKARISPVPESTAPSNAAPGASEGGAFERGTPRRPVSELAEDDVLDRPPIARTRPHRLSDSERSEILRAAERIA